MVKCQLGFVNYNKNICFNFVIRSLDNFFILYKIKLVAKIFYFTGTGNSLWSAKEIAKALNEPCEFFNIGKEVKNDNIYIEADIAIFVFPSYAYGLPLAVKKFLEKAVFKVSYLAAFVTYGTQQGGTLGAFRKIIKKKNVEKMYFGKIPAVENYLALFGTPKEKTKTRRLLMQEEATKKAAAAVLARKENRVNTIRPFSIFIVWVFHTFALPLFYKKYKLSDNCNGCAVCEKICPVSGITMKDGKPVFGKTCEHCQACLNICPSRAIQFGRVRFGTTGYKHPEIKISELGCN